MSFWVNLLLRQCYDWTEMLWINASCWNRKSSRTSSFHWFFFSSITLKPGHSSILKQIYWQPKKCYMRMYTAFHIQDHLEFNTRDATTSSTKYHNPNTNCHQKSFFPNTSRAWNKLPLSTTSITDSTIFQNQLKASATSKNMTNLSLWISTLKLSDVPVWAVQLCIQIQIQIQILGS